MTVATDTARTLERIIADDPTLRAMFTSLSPRWRYYGSGSRRYCYTVSPARDERGRMRYASWVYRVKGGRLVPSQRRNHAKRKDAKARALELFLITTKGA